MSPSEPEGARQRLTELRHALLKLHKTLVDSERVSYEKTIGKIQSPNHFLQLLTGDPWFAWLRPLSQLIVAMDEAPEPAGEVDGNGEEREPADGVKEQVGAETRPPLAMVVTHGAAQEADVQDAGEQHDTDHGRRAERKHEPQAVLLRSFGNAAAMENIAEGKKEEPGDTAA